MVYDPQKSSVRMQLSALLLFTVLHFTEGCTLDKTPQEMTARSGESVLLPCYCTDHKAPERFTWKKNYEDRQTWGDVSNESGQYRGRLQLFNSHSPGNLSLLISHLTEEDRGWYRCAVEGSEYRDIRLTVKGCRLDTGPVQITAESGGSVLLPCYCTDLLTKPDTLKWQKLDTWEEVSSERDQYRNRVQLGDGQHPGNLSLLITHLTENDSGLYRCYFTEKDYRDLKLTVEGTSVTPSTPAVSGRTSQTPSSEPLQNGPPIPVICAAVGGLLVLLLLGLVVYWRCRAQRQGGKEGCERHNESGRDQQLQDCVDGVYCTIPSEPTDEPAQDQTSSEALYASVNNQSKRKKTEEKDDVTYSTVVHNKPSTSAHTLLDTGDTTEYACIKRS